MEPYATDTATNKSVANFLFVMVGLFSTDLSVAKNFFSCNVYNSRDPPFEILALLEDDCNELLSY